MEINCTQYSTELIRVRLGFTQYVIPGPSAGRPACPSLVRAACQRRRLRVRRGPAQHAPPTAQSGPSSRAELGLFGPGTGLKQFNLSVSLSFFFSICVSDILLLVFILRQCLTIVSTLVQPLPIPAKVSKVFCCMSFAFC